MKEKSVEHFIKINEFIDQNYEYVLDYGLMDVVLIDEYRASLVKLSTSTDEQDKKKVCEWLEFMVNQIKECANDNISVGRKYPIYEACLNCVNN